MSLSFKVDHDPDPEIIERISSLTSQSAFNSAAYVLAQKQLGYLPCALYLADNSTIDSGCIGFLRGPRVFQKLSIPTAPNFEINSIFWKGLSDVCSELGICTLQLDTYASLFSGYVLYDCPHTIVDRTEFVIDIQCDDLFGRFSKNHKRNIRKAEKAGLQLLRTTDGAACVAHLESMRDSSNRRLNRGELAVISANTELYSSLLKTKAAEAFQVMLDGKTLSSMIILRSEKAAYYQSAGTTSDGMKIGASQYLVWKLIGILQSENTKLLNLGGAGAQAEGLRRFKSGFGAEELSSKAISYDFVTGSQRKVRRLAYRILSALGRC